MNLENLNLQLKEKSAGMLKSCCGSSKWVEQMLHRMPFSDVMQMARFAEEIWYEICKEEDWLEAFSHHPKIGDLQSLKDKFASTAHLAGNEQATVSQATDEVISSLARLNEEYQNKFGFIFIICATGKPAEEMLKILEGRLDNDRSSEIRIAMGEQHKITLLRLKNSMEADWGFLKVSQITTHVLDTAAGRPAEGIAIRLSNHAHVIAQGLTNVDGRITDLLPPGRIVAPGHYRMTFDTGGYYAKKQLKTFYPVAEIQFEIFDGSHYHIPLLLSPFGYSTYRGS
jgi:5-hydroxyisourate hydrolase/2-oxo-4-hydroxy-4-carboxy-5-ureidoimidazoline decarboxylase